MNAAGDVTFDLPNESEASSRALTFALGNGVVFVLAAPPEQAFAQQGPMDTVCFFAGGELVDLPNGLGLSWRHEAEPASWFVPGNAWCDDGVQRLSLEDGCSERSAVVEDAQGRQTEWHEKRFVSLAHANLVLLRWTVTPRNWAGSILVRSQLDFRAHPLGAGPAWAHGGEPAAVQNLMPADGLAAKVTGPGGRPPHLRVDVALRVSGAPGRQAGRGHNQTSSYQQHHVEVAQGELVCIDVAMSVTDAAATAPAVGGPGLVPGFEQELERQRATWRTLWSRVHLSLPQDAPFARAMRFNAFHLLQAVSPLSVGRDVGLPAWAARRGTPGQEAWDETLALPFYSLHLPALARELLNHRARRLAAGLSAAEARPWRAASAFNVWSHHMATQDRALLGAACGDVMVGTARYWMNQPIGELGLPGAWALKQAAQLRELLLPAAWDRLCGRLQIEAHEPGTWHQRSQQVPLAWSRDGALLPPEGSEGLDVLRALHLLGADDASELLAHVGAAAPAEWHARTVQHHMARASPTPATRVIVAGALSASDPSASWAAFHKVVHGPLAERPDADDGFSFGAMGGAWDVLQRHYLGVQPQLRLLRLKPRPPDALDDVDVRVCLGGHWLNARLQDAHLTLQSDAGAPPLDVEHHDERHVLVTGEPLRIRCR